jgi:hypothetical protein
MRESCGRQSVFRIGSSVINGSCSADILVSSINVGSINVGSVIRQRGKGRDRD